MGVCQSIPSVDNNGLWYEEFSPEEREEWMQMSSTERQLWIRRKNLERQRMLSARNTLRSQFIIFARRGCNVELRKMKGNNSVVVLPAVLKLLWSQDVDSSTLQWTVTSDVRESDMAPLTHITRVCSGTQAQAFKDVHNVEPWRCFSVETVEDVYAFVTKEHEEQELWVQGLRLLADLDVDPIDDQDGSVTAPSDTVRPDTQVDSDDDGDHHRNVGASVRSTSHSKQRHGSASATRAVSAPVSAPAPESVTDTTSSPTNSKKNGSSDEDWNMVTTKDAQQNENKEVVVVTAAERREERKREREEAAKRKREAEERAAEEQQHKHARYVVGKGHEFLKFCRRAKPHKRFIYCDESGAKLDWGTGKMKISEVVTVQKGLSGKGLKYLTDLGNIDRCLSIVHKKRTLDLMAADVETRNLWLMGLTDLVDKAKGVHRSASTYNPSPVNSKARVKKSLTTGGFTRM